MDSKYNLWADAHKQRIRRVVCSGGGAKGAFYPGSYKAMRDTGLFNGVEVFAGASAGAITAAFMAVNMPSNVLRDKLLSTNLEDLTGSIKPALFKAAINPPGVLRITRDGKPLEHFIRENIVETVRNSLKNMPNLEKISKQEHDLKMLVNKINKKDARITFDDLALLNRFFPEHFKQLVMLAVKLPGGEVQIFNSALTPDVEIALACRASASIPLYLEPVTIEIDGVKQRFVDGGVYDNSPTDYFNVDEYGKVPKNEMREQTLVFAFGNGLDNEKNSVFQALYGLRWDEVVTEELLVQILSIAAEWDKNYDLANRDSWDQADELTQLLKRIIKTYVSKETITKDAAKVIVDAMQSIENLLLDPEKDEKFWAAYVKEKMKPVLHKANFFERFTYNYLTGKMGSLKSPYKITQQSEKLYQRLRSEYPLRTVEMRAGGIGMIDFKKATKLARVLDSLGYLDTVNHITNHELHDSIAFNQEQFYSDLITNFEVIHRAILLGVGEDPAQDLFTKEINSLKDELKNKEDGVISRQVYYLIKDHAENSMDGFVAYALSRAVEFHNKILTAEELFKETCQEGLKQNIGLNTLADRNRFDLYGDEARYKKLKQSIINKVREALKELEQFNEEANQFSPKGPESTIK